MNNNSLWSDAIYRLSRNRAAMIGGFILIMLIILAALAPWIAPYSYSYQDLNLGASPPSADHILSYVFSSYIKRFPKFTFKFFLYFR